MCECAAFMQNPHINTLPIAARQHPRAQAPPGSDAWQHQHSVPNSGSVCEAYNSNTVCRSLRPVGHPPLPDLLTMLYQAN
jgi:hypothetical protein